MDERILFVDDEEFILSLAERIFADQGIEILTANNPFDALAKVQMHEIAALVSDNMMPEMTGIELISRVKVISPDTVNILMTGYASLQTAIDAINKAEAFRFVIKPWDNFALLEMVEDALKAFETGDLKLVEGFSEKDDSLDSMRWSIFRECVTYMIEDPKNITQCAHYIMIAKYLERVADHACKMSEKIHYMITGEHIEVK